MSTEKQRNTRDQLLLLALAVGATHAQAALTAGVSERTVRRRVATPGFEVELTRARDQYVAQMAHRLTGQLTTAVDTVTELMGGGAPPAVRLRAALGLLKTHREWRVATEIEDRLRALEEARETDEGEAA